MFATYAKPQHGWLRRSAFCAFLLSLVAGPLLGQTAFINEIHYDNTGKDTGEAIEIAGPAGDRSFRLGTRALQWTEWCVIPH